MLTDPSINVATFQMFYSTVDIPVPLENLYSL